MISDVTLVLCSLLLNLVSISQCVNIRWGERHLLFVLLVVGEAYFETFEASRGFREESSMPKFRYFTFSLRGTRIISPLKMTFSLDLITPFAPLLQTLFRFISVNFGLWTKPIISLVVLFQENEAQETFCNPYRDFFDPVSPDGDRLLQTLPDDPR